MTVFVTADVPAYECADPPLDRLWRAAVGKDDLVYVIVGESDHWVLPQVDALPGRKRLITGVEKIDGGFLLSPLPVHPSQIEPGEINLHGRPSRAISPSLQPFANWFQFAAETGVLGWPIVTGRCANEAIVSLLNTSSSGR